MRRRQNAGVICGTSATEAYFNEVLLRANYPAKNLFINCQYQRDNAMNRKSNTYSFFLILLVLTIIIPSCVIPGPPDELIELEAKPDRNIMPVGAVFDPQTELKVTALFNTGVAFVVPAPDWAASTPPDTSTPGEQTGAVEYLGKTASYTIFVYDGDGGSGTYSAGEPELHIPLY
jgi:hypothetical protein